MNENSRITEVVRNTLIGSAIWLLGQTSTVVACTDDFYVFWVEGEDGTDIYVRHVLVDPTGVSDLWGQISIPDDGVGNDNPSYMHAVAVNAVMHNTKLEITTDGQDCVISANGDFLGNAVDVGIANLIP